ncbi:MAG: hypothetical protein K2X35_04375 [Bryobacteraceae bacterium]|nr:hypothetical protein [Bryobacteraceae bacterium]
MTAEKYKRLEIVYVFSILTRRVLPLALAVWLALILRDLAFAALDASSEAQVWITLMSEAKRTRLFALAFGVFAAWYGLWERALRIRTETRLRARIEELEKRIISSEGLSA